MDETIFVDTNIHKSSEIDDISVRRSSFLAFDRAQVLDIQDTSCRRTGASSHANLGQAWANPQ